MILTITVLIILLATGGIFTLRRLTGRLTFRLLQDAQLDGMLKFQGAQLALALLVLLAAYALNPANFQAFFRLGEPAAPSSGVSWLDIPAGMPWWQAAASLGFWITAVTFLFMYFQLRQAGIRFKAWLVYLPWVLLFSAMNAFTEESIFRAGIVIPLYGQLAAPLLCLLSGALFGLPHYFGMPRGLVGTLMAGFLGWLLALSLVETHGLLLAWAVHAVQDVVIIGGLLAASASKDRQNAG